MPLPASPIPAKAVTADNLAVPKLGRFIAELLKAVDWRWLPLPPLLLAVEFALLISIPRNEINLKDLFETLAIIVLTSAIGLGLLRSCLQREPFLIWMTCFVGALLFREFHLFKASTTVVYLMVLALWIIAWQSYPRMATYLRCRRVMTPIMLTGICYVISQTLDIDTFKYGNALFPIVEEIMEVTGHCFALLLVAAARPKALSA